MLKISCYYTTQDKLPKAFTGIVEKCFQSNLKTVVITPNTNFSNNLDNILWTYSKKNFIPHSTNADPFPELQPIYISDKIENPNKAKVAIFVGPDRNKILTFLSENTEIKISEFTRIICLFDETANLNSQTIQNLLKDSPLKAYTGDALESRSYSIEYFKQSPTGEWYNL